MMPIQPARLNLGQYNRMKDTKKYIFLIISIFTLSRLCLYALGMKFDTSTLSWYWQIIDFQLLKNNLFESILYLHSQPPLFNIFLGIIIKIFPNIYILIFHLIFLLIGLSISLLFYIFLRKLLLSPRLSFDLTLIFMLNPATFLIENQLFYDYPVIFFVLLSAVLLQNMCERLNIKNSFLFFLNISILILLRSTFHPIWYLLIFIGLLILFSKNKKTIIVSSFFPAFLILIFLVKNLVLFNEFTLSTWFGMNIYKTLYYVKKEKKLDPPNLNNISRTLQELEPFSQIKDYPKNIISKNKTGIPVLDNEYKSIEYKGEKQTNFNNINYIKISDIYMKDSISYIAKNSVTYFSSHLKRAYENYSWPITSKSSLYDNRHKGILDYERIFNLFFYGKSYFIFYLFPLFIFLCIKFIKNLPKKLLKQKSVIIFMFFTIIYIFIVGNLFEIGENNRYRFSSELFFIALIGLLINNYFKKKSLTNNK